MDMLDIDSFTQNMIEQGLVLLYEGLTQIQKIMKDTDIKIYSFHAGAFQDNKNGHYYKKTYLCTFFVESLKKNIDFKKVLFQLDTYEQFIGQTFKPEHTKLNPVGQSTEFKMTQKTVIIDLLKDVLKEENFIYLEHYVMNQNKAQINTETISQNTSSKIKI